MKIVYSRHYDIGFFGLERLHPFDSRKYSRAWRCLRRKFGRRVNRLRATPSRPVSRDKLLHVHTADYLDDLRKPGYVAAALELPIVRKLPPSVIDLCVLRPMRWGVTGSMLAAEEAIRVGLAVNLSGGYHHAKPDEGEGFCVYGDVALAVDTLRRAGRLDDHARVAHIDLDAHLGNGICHMFHKDPRVFMLDAYNHTIYPCYDSVALERVDCPVPLHAGWTSEEYLGALKDKLPGFLNSIHSSQPIDLAIYNAGTDVYEHDAIGNLNVTAEHILERDMFVIEQLRDRKIPVMMVLSGGYSRQSYQLVFATVSELVKRYGDLHGGD
jgi:histone deacetylase 11